MSETAISCIVFACVFGGALLGMILRASLPESHLSTDSKDFLKRSCPDWCGKENWRILPES
jgi:hypothetical protein